METSHETFGARLKTVRELRGWSQDELARLAQVPVEVIVALEQGAPVRPRVTQVGRLAQALGVPKEEVLLTWLFEDRPRKPRTE